MENITGGTCIVCEENNTDFWTGSIICADDSYKKGYRKRAVPYCGRCSKENDIVYVYLRATSRKVFASKKAWRIWSEEHPRKQLDLDDRGGAVFLEEVKNGDIDFRKQLDLTDQNGGDLNMDELEGDWHDYWDR